MDTDDEPLQTLMILEYARTDPAVFYRAMEEERSETIAFVILSSLLAAAFALLWEMNNDERKAFLSFFNCMQIAPFLEEG
ncbi:hypothetical protein PRIPAC_93746 [Pristionchus pacificus]|uniref:Uncharacterized protein n=1 Tax=Pristionchus pacificus TaxID=54126 RepID=A0A2A6CDH0_PRIPA|nr:hypothetical protein PRIPAC_93746 [Pristionchus pacificus]|eukprot:PDM76166.1 hypothetical protein PRIPAC_39770 [Pristionchus pacificus]